MDMQALQNSVGQQPQQDQPQQTPFGSSPATGPTQNRGYEAAGMARVSLIVKMMGEAIPLVGATSDIGMALLDAIKTLVKKVPTGAVAPSSEQNQLQQLMQKQQQAGPQMAAMRAKMSPGGMPANAPAGASGKMPM